MEVVNECKRTLTGCNSRSIGNEYDDMINHNNHDTNEWSRTCHVVQNKPYNTSCCSGTDDMIVMDEPTLDDLRVLCTRESSSDDSYASTPYPTTTNTASSEQSTKKIRKNVYYGGTAHSISRKVSNTSSLSSFNKPLLRIKIPSYDKYNPVGFEEEFL